MKHYALFTCILSSWGSMVENFHR